MNNNYFTVVQWPDVQELMEIPGFSDNSYPISDDKGLEKFGSSSYFVSTEWLNALNE